MGVHGLWRLIEPSGKPVPVESLENKVLAVDVSIWLHQAIKGFQDAKGAPAVNAHLLGIFHRVCKLLYFKVKPVFVFDGGVPALKRETIAKRNKLKHKNISEADKIQKQLLETLLKHSAVNKVLGDKAKAAATSTSPTKSGNTNEDLFKLPSTELDSTKTSSDEEEESTSETDSGSPTKHWNLHNIDTKSQQFKLLPADVRHEILTDLKETRKQSSWGRLHELPTKSDDFSGFQMKRLLKRQEVQEALEEAEKEMGGHSLSLGELEEILKDQGVISKNTMGSRIASDENTRYLYIRDVKQALEKARLQEEKKLSSIKEETENKEELEKGNEISINKADLELENDLQQAIVLSLQDQPSSSGYVQKKKISEFSFLENFNDEDFESEGSDTSDVENEILPKSSALTSAQNYMMEYSGLNPNEIAKIIASNEGRGLQKRKLDKIKERDHNEIEEQSKELANHRKDKESPVLAEAESKKVKLSRMSDKDEVQPIENVKIISGSEESDGDFEEVKDSSEDKEPPDLTEAEFEKVKPSGISDINEVQPVENVKMISGSEESDGDFEEVKDSLDIMEPHPKEESTKNETDKPDEVEIMSDSGESDHDFVEVRDISAKKVKIEDEKLLEIKIETSKYEEEDDLFADIFTPKTELQQSITDENVKVPTREDIFEKAEVVNKNTEPQKVENKRTDLLQDLMKKAEEVKTKDSKSKLTEEELVKMKNDLDKEHLELRTEQGLRERLGTNITDQMYKEAQDLLELFGLPYIVAPMEAEAQCAFLETASLTDGTITDDSDIWLFGGKTVYKNFFNQSKHVLEYRAEDIKHHFKLSREQMILLALLVGSDYTTGLQGVGPVTALEILAAFPSSNTSSFTLSHNQLLMGLTEFKMWFTKGRTVGRGRHSLRNKLKNLTFTDNFPSIQVVQAYLNPTVDANEEKFSWSKPDIVSLIDFGRSKFGWSKTKTEEILKPVIKKMKETKYQSTLLNYFQIKHNMNPEEAQKLMSERVKSAIKRIGQDPEDAEDSDEEVKPKKSKKSKKSISEGEINKPMSASGKNGQKTGGPIGLLSDDEFIEVDQLEMILESVENNEKCQTSVENDRNGNNKSKKRLKKETSEILRKTKTKNHKQRLITNKQTETIKNNENEPKALKLDEMSNKDDVNRQNKELCISENVDKIENKGDNPIIEVKDNQNPNSSKHVLNKNNEELTTFKYVSSQIAKAKKSEKIKIPKDLKGKKNVRTKKEKVSCATSLRTTEDLDEELLLLKETEALSEKRMEEIKIEAEKKLQQELNMKKLITRKLHIKETIPQRERDQKNVVRTRLRAIEVFRKSKIDPSPKKRGAHKLRTPKDDACLSESSSDSDL